MIDVEKLKALLATMNGQCESCGGCGVVECAPEDDCAIAAFIDCEACDCRGNNRERTMVACLNALPQLLAVYEAACRFSGEFRFEHDDDQDRLDEVIDALNAAVDAARSVR